MRIRTAISNQLSTANQAELGESAIFRFLLLLGTSKRIAQTIYSSDNSVIELKNYCYACDTGS